MRIPFLLGRILFGGFFVYNGINHFRQRHALAQYARAKKMPKPEAAVVASGALLLLGGGSILLGMKPKYGALATMVFLAAASAKIHDFWNAEDPNQKMNDMINFSKNLALFGASMALMSIEEPWPASLQAAESGLRRIAA